MVILPRNPPMRHLFITLSNAVERTEWPMNCCCGGADFNDGRNQSQTDGPIGAVNSSANTVANGSNVTASSQRIWPTK
jgi:hypothetical protein